MSDRHTRAAVAFAVLEGIALGVCEALGVLEGAGSPVDELRVGGGGAHLDVLGRIKADALGRTVRHLAVDPAALGAAMLAGEAAGVGAQARAAIAGAVRRAGGSIRARRRRRTRRRARPWFEQVRPAAACTHAVAPARRMPADDRLPARGETPLADAGGPAVLGAAVFGVLGVDLPAA
jgi:sugar (pentulose or hexulose) kinase